MVPNPTLDVLVCPAVGDRAFPVAAARRGTVSHRTSLLTPLSPSSAVVLNHISSHFLIPLADSDSSSWTHIIVITFNILTFKNPFANGGCCPGVLCPPPGGSVRGDGGRWWSPVRHRLVTARNDRLSTVPPLCRCAGCVLPEPDTIPQTDSPPCSFE